jgi:hypothetical protein
MKRTQINKDIEPKSRHGANEHIFVQHELQVEGTLLRPGDQFRVKGERGDFIFQCFAHNTKLDVSWIECFDAAMQFRSVRPEKIIVPRKRGRR